MILRSFSILNRIDIPATYPAYSVLSSLELPFSILNRIDIPATAVFAISCHDESDFQYPQPDRYPCNSNTAHTRTSAGDLSVSSTGSISLQHNRRIASICPLLIGLSVSSTGSISLQQAQTRLSQTPRNSFSILNRIDIPATLLYVLC